MELAWIVSLLVLVFVFLFSDVEDGRGIRFFTTIFLAITGLTLLLFVFSSPVVMEESIISDHHNFGMCDVVFDKPVKYVKVSHKYTFFCFSDWYEYKIYTKVGEQ